MKTLLVVDDEPPLLDIAKMYFEKNEDFTVDTAISAREALEMMETATSNAIISNYQMPEMDAIEFLKTVRDSGSHIPSIIFTEKGREDGGVFGPFDKNQIIDAVKIVMDSPESKAELKRLIKEGRK